MQDKSDPTTTQLLAEIGTGTAAEAVMAVRYNTSPPGPTFIPTLDDVLLGFRPHRDNSAFRRGDLIELVGPSGSGKTSLMTFMIMTTVLPVALPAPLETSLGGKAAHAVIFQPLTHRSILPRLRTSMVSHVRASSPFASDELVEKVVGESMSRIRVWRGKPRWKDIALGLRGILNDISPWSGDERRYPEGLDLLVLDGLADGYYPQRWAEEGRGQRVPSGPAKLLGADDVGLRQVMEAIGIIRKELGSVVVMSVQGLRISRESQPSFIPHMPPPYPNPFTSSSSNPPTPKSKFNPTYWPLNIQITLSGRARGLQLPGDTALIDALRAKSREGRDRGERSGKGDLYQGIAKMTRSDGSVIGKDGAKFHFRIGEEGLQVWGD